MWKTLISYIGAVSMRLSGILKKCYLIGTFEVNVPGYVIVTGTVGSSMCRTLCLFAID